MNFQSEQLRLENEFDVLKQMASQTNEAWNDPVQLRFYDQFLDNFPKEFRAYITELSKLDKSFEIAERTINELR